MGDGNEKKLGGFNKAESILLILQGIGLAMATFALIGKIFPNFPESLTFSDKALYVIASITLFLIIYLLVVFFARPKTKNASLYGMVVVALAGISLLMGHAYATWPKIPLAPFKIKEVTHHLTITNDGDGILNRVQTIEPKFPLYAIYECDLASSGEDIDTNNFELAINEIDKRTSNHIGEPFLCTPSSWQIGTNELRTDITPALSKGKLYERKMIFRAAGAFTNPARDVFIVNINYPTDKEIIKVDLPHGVKWDVSKLKYRQQKHSGQVIWEQDVKPYKPAITNNSIIWNIDKPCVGDRYVIEWYYADK